MPTTKPKAPPPFSEYEQNRQLFTDEQLAPYDRQWVAFSLDGQRIVAGGSDLLELDQHIQDAGEDPENVGLEFIDLSPETWVGGVEFGGLSNFHTSPNAFTVRPRRRFLLAASIVGGQRWRCD